MAGEKRIQLFKKGLGDGGLQLLSIVALASTSLRVRRRRVTVM